MSRRTETSSAVKMEWIKNNYKRYGISLRYDTDGELIDYLESHKDEYQRGPTGIIRKALESYIKKEG